MNAAMPIVEGFILLVVLWIASNVKAAIASYSTEKGKNLATKEDVEAITRKVEGVKDELALGAKRREMVAEIAEFIAAYKASPAATATDEQRRDLEAAYYRLVMWIPSDVLTMMTQLMAESPSGPRPDVKDLLIEARKAILGDAAGTFTGPDLVHLVDHKT